MSAAPSPFPYLDAFEAPSHDAWRTAVDKVLRGADFEKRLVGCSADGIRIEPLYPAAAPSARALRAECGRWHVAARLDHPQPGEARALAHADLEGGADTLTISFAGAQAARGYGLVADNVEAVDAALDGIMLDLIRLRIDPAPQGRLNALLLAALVEKRGHQPADLMIEFGLNPIGVLASQGTLAATWPEIQRRHASTIEVLTRRGFKGPFLAVDGRPFHEAGASEALELGAVLATAVAYLRMLEAKGLAVTEARDALAFTLVADTDEFLTVAKFRAARLLWDRVQNACGLTPKPAIIHAETAWRSLTRRDPWVNLLRGTLAAFSAGIGGADSLTVTPFTAALGLPDGFARRVARNTQLILLDESNLWRVADPAAGAGGFEALTESLCEQAWQVFQEFEAQRSGDLSGIVAGLVNGYVQKLLSKQRASRMKAIAVRRQPITGVSEFPNIHETPVAVLSVAPVIRGGPQLPGSLAEQDQEEIIQSFVRGAGRDDAMVLDLKSVRTGALPSVRLAEPYEALRDRTDELPERPVVFLATLGSVADFTARAGFARNLFEAGGLAAPTGDGFAHDGATDLDALVDAYRASGAKLACLCGSDRSYADEGAAVAEALVKAGASVWLAGRPEEHNMLRKSGVSWFIFTGCDAVEALEWAQAFVLSRKQP